MTSTAIIIRRLQSTVILWRLLIWWLQ